MSLYILLRVKPKLLSAKTGSRRFPDVMGGMDSGFSLCAVPAFCCGPGISDRGRYTVYVHPTSREAVAELRDEAGRFPVEREVE